MKDYIKLVDKNVDGCGTDIDIILELNTSVTNGMKEIINAAIKDCKQNLEGEWTSDDVFDSVIEVLEKIYEVKVNVIYPSTTIEF